MAGTGEAVPGPVSAEQHRSVPSWLVPPSGSSLSTRSVPCSMRFTGRPRLIPDEDSTRCMTRSTAGTSWNRRRTQAQPGLAGSGRTPPVKGVGEPCAGEPHARFDGRGLETERTSVTRLLGPPPQRVGHNPHMRADPLDRGIQRQRRILGHRLTDQPHRPLTQLVGILPRCWHDPTLPWNQTLHETRGDSDSTHQHAATLPATRGYTHPRPDAGMPVTSGSYPPM